MIILFALALAGCQDSGSTEAKDDYQKVRENVWDYVQHSEIALREKEAWLNGEIKEKVVNQDIVNHQQVDKMYLDKTVIMVVPADSKKYVAYPSILVDPDSEEIIAVLPGY
jgi:hypothetical protein